MTKSHRIKHRVSELSAFLLGIILTFLTAGILISIAVLLQDYSFRDGIYPSVTVDGVSMGHRKVSDIQDKYSKLNTQLSHTQIELKYNEGVVATYSGELLKLHSDGAEIAKQAYLIARQGSSLTQVKEKLQSLLKLRTFEFTTHLDYDESPITDTLKLLALQYNVEPRNALFELKGNKVSAFSIEKNGLLINADEVRGSIRNTLLSPKVLSRSTKPFIFTVNSVVVKPLVTLAQANTQGITELIGEGTSNYTHSIPGRIHNLLLASDKLHGTLIPRGAVFSYNDTVGEISARTGYQQAYVIVNGRTELGDGGGVCQTSTTLFRAAINSGLPISEWTAHAYRVGYYENDSKPGRDATVYSPSVDLKFVNDTPAAILIQVESNLDDKTLIYRLWGKMDDRKVTISDVSTSGALPAPPDRYQDDPSLKKGVTKQVDWAAGGLRAWFDYKVTKGLEVIQEKTFVSNYKPWQAVYLVGTQD
ncbi:MAG: VanW family protein [Candidatus Roizmanbacteria bacterium]